MDTVALALRNVQLEDEVRAARNAGLAYKKFLVGFFEVMR